MPLSPVTEDETPLTIVYVEDDERLARLTSQYLTSHGVEVVHVARGDAAVAEVLRVRPDVVLLDLMLPGIDGLEVCRKIRSMEQGPYKYLLLLTAKDDKQDIVAGLEAGADDYITKPINARSFLNLVEKHCLGFAPNRNRQIALPDVVE